MKYSNLQKPGRIGGLELKNRVLMLPMLTSASGLLGEVSDDMIEWYERRAEGGAGLIVVEICMTATAIDPLKLAARELRADDNSYIPGLASLAEAVHEKGAKIGIQLTPGTGVQASGGSYILGSKETPLPVSPSGVPAYGKNNKSRDLSTDEVEEIIKLTAASAVRVKMAGFDMVEIHAHGGYLIAQFLSPFFNKRNDKYGGSQDGRFRFLLEILSEIKKVVGPSFPVTVKYSIDEYIEGGRGIEESLVLAKKLEEAGADGITASCGLYGSKVPACPPYYFKPGVLLTLAEAVKKTVNIPVIAIGRLDDPEFADSVLNEGKADFIGLGRALISDPDWPKKVEKGEPDRIRKCIACNECREGLSTLNPLRCVVNPVAGREKKYGHIKRTEMSKKVVIVGGGPAGMEASRVAALRGHKVILFEATNELGGGVNLASIPPHKDVFSNITDFYSKAFADLNIDIRFGKKANSETILSEDPDVVIIATGAVHRFPAIEGINNPIVVTASDVLSAKAEVGNKVIVAGGGSIGCEVANFLAQKGKDVAIVEVLESVGIGVERWIWMVLSSELSQAGVKILTSKRITEITDKGAWVANGNDDRYLLEAETVVLALGFTPFDELSEKLLGKCKEVHIIGDARSPRRIINAISEGFITGYEL